MTAHGYDPHFGARFLKRTIERTLTTAIAEFLVRAPLRAGSRIAVRVRGNDVVATNAREPTVDKTRVRVAARTDASPKTLDRAALLRETQLLVARARPLRDRLAARREEAQALLARINAEGFWQELATANAIMDDYRGLDVAIRVESRLDGPLVHLEACIAEDAKVKVDVLAQKYDAARRALVDWEARAAEGGARAVWIVIANADVRSKSDAWLPALAAIEMAWCARLGLTVESVAFAIRDERVTHIVLEAEGPGASTYLAAEGGIHRRHGTTRDPERARIDVFEARLEAVAPPPASSPASAAAPARVPGKATAGPFDVKGAWSAALTIGANHVTFAAADAAALARFMRDAVAAHPFEGVAELVRTYGQDGTAARDVITGATIARWRDVERGAFEPLLDARRADATRPDA